MDHDSVGAVGRGAYTLGRSGASMSEAAAVFLIFVILAIALTSDGAARVVASKAPAAPAD